MTSMQAGRLEGRMALGIDNAGRAHIRDSKLPIPLHLLPAAEAGDVLSIYTSWFGV